MILTRFKLWAIGVGAAILAALAALWRVFRLGKASARHDIERRALARARRARAIENETETLSEADVVDILRRNGWLRDDDDHK